MTPSALQTRSTDALCGPAQNFQIALLIGIFNLRDLLSVLHTHCCLWYSVTRFRNWLLAHVTSCQSDIGPWHRLYISALLWSQDSWSSFFIGTSYKDHQVKRRCVREKFTEWSLEVWMFKFYIKKCYCIVHVLVKRSKTFKNPLYLQVSANFNLLWSISNQGPHDPHLSTLTKRLQRHLPYLLEIWNLYQKNIFPETSKIRRNSGNPKKTEILVFRISKKSIW